MDVSKGQAMEIARPNFAADLTRFALASLGTGLATAVVAAAVVMVLVA